MSCSFDSFVLVRNLISSDFNFFILLGTIKLTRKMMQVKRKVCVQFYKHSLRTVTDLRRD